MKTSRHEGTSDMPEQTDVGVSATPLQAALSYAARGLKVIPLHTAGVDGRCSCRRGCTSVGKHPRTMKGVKDATTDPSIIRKWWRKWPDANLGIATGAGSGIIGLDVDDGHGGWESLAALQDAHGPLPRTLATATGGGGSHSYYRHPGGRVANNAGKIAPGIDLRGDGGFVVAPPSRHHSGEPYRWVPGCSPDQVPLADAPAWLLERLLGTTNKATNARATDRPTDAILEGTRNDTLTSLAGTMRRRGMGEEAIAAALLKENAARCQPPLLDEEVMGIAQSVASYPTRYVDALDHQEGQSSGGDQPDHDQAGAGPGTPLNHSGGWVKLSEVTPESIIWLSPSRLAAGKLTDLTGDPGLGKSTLVANWAASLSRGWALPGGEAPDRPQGVVLLAQEDGLADTVRPRMDAAGADLDRILALTERPAGGTYSIPRDLGLIEQAIAEVDGALFVIDPLVAHLDPGLNAFRDQDVRRALGPLATMAERTGCAVVVVRHLRKTAGGNPLYRGGGSVGIIAAARVGLLVAADPQDPERRVLAVTKGNLAKPAPSLAFRLVAADGTDVARVEYLGETAHTAARLLDAADEPEGPRAEAKEWLMEVLEVGPVSAKEVGERAKQDGISLMTLRRAGNDLGIEKTKIGLREGWRWSLPTCPVADDGATTSDAWTHDEMGQGVTQDDHLTA